MVSGIVNRKRDLENLRFASCLTEGCNLWCINSRNKCSKNFQEDEDAMDMYFDYLEFQLLECIFEKGRKVGVM